MMKRLRAATAGARAFLNTRVGRQVEHVAAVFAVTFAVTAIFNGKHLLDAHGLSALASAAPAVIVSALYAGWAKIRPLIPAAVAADIPGVAKLAARAKKP